MKLEVDGMKEQNGITYKIGSRWHEGTKQFLGCMGLLAIIIALCGGSIYLVSRIQNPASVLATETQTPIVYFTPTPPPTLTPTPQQYERCVVIDGKNPPGRQNDGRAPTSFSAWLELGQPDELIFYNFAGPDATNTPQVVNRQTLPTIVHNGDRFCLSNNPNYFYFFLLFLKKIIQNIRNKRIK